MSASDCDLFLWTPASGVELVTWLVMTPMVLTSDVRDWGPPPVNQSEVSIVIVNQSEACVTCDLRCDHTAGPALPHVPGPPPGQGALLLRQHTQLGPHKAVWKPGPGIK